jgi:hypothetical protein
MSLGLIHNPDLLASLALESTKLGNSYEFVRLQQSTGLIGPVRTLVLRCQTMS